MSSIKVSQSKDMYLYDKESVAYKLVQTDLTQYMLHDSICNLIHQAANLYEI